MMSWEIQYSAYYSPGPDQSVSRRIEPKFQEQIENFLSIVLQNLTSLEERLIFYH